MTGELPSGDARLRHPAEVRVRRLGPRAWPPYAMTPGTMKERAEDSEEGASQATGRVQPRRRPTHAGPSSRPARPATRRRTAAGTDAWKERSHCVWMGRRASRQECDEDEDEERPERAAAPAHGSEELMTAMARPAPGAR
jgi:hypothetical protein